MLALHNAILTMGTIVEVITRTAALGEIFLLVVAINVTLTSQSVQRRPVIRRTTFALTGGEIGFSTIAIGIFKPASLAMNTTPFALTVAGTVVFNSTFVKTGLAALTRSAPGGWSPIGACTRTLT